MAEDKDKNRKAAPEETEVTEKPDYSWKSADMLQQGRNKNWYVIIVLVGTILATLLAYQGLWSGTVLIALAIIVLISGARIEPKEVECTLYPQGVVVDDQVYDFGAFKSYWLSLAELPKIKLQRVGRFAGQVDLPLQNADIDKVRSLLAKHLPEEEDKGEDLVDTINRIIKL